MLLVRALEPVERHFLVVEACVHERDRRGRHVLALGEPPQLGDRVPRGVGRAIPSVRVPEMSDKRGAAV